MDHTAHYTLEVQPGMPEGHEVVFDGEADESPDWEPGDIVLRVRSKKEQGGFRRKETSLYWKETIGIDEVRLVITSVRSLALTALMILQALLGFERNLTHLDGRTVTLSRKSVTQPGYVQVLKGEGMPYFNRPDLHGDLYVEYNVVLPTELTPQMRRSKSPSPFSCNYWPRKKWY
jgi:DnaJ-related protein SCJ1